MLLIHTDGTCSSSGVVQTSIAAARKRNVPQSVLLLQGPSHCSPGLFRYTPFCCRSKLRGIAVIVRDHASFKQHALFMFEQGITANSCGQQLV